MKLIARENGYEGLRTDTDAGVFWFPREMDRLVFTDGEPTAIKAKTSGHVCLVVPQMTILEVKGLRFIRRANCHPRPSDITRPEGTQWNSNAIYSIYGYDRMCGERKVYIPVAPGKPKAEYPVPLSETLVISVQHGTGAHFWHIDNKDMFRSLVPVLETMEEIALWDFCHHMTGSHEAGYKFGRRETAQEYSLAILEGRAKKRTKGGRRFVEIESPKPQVV